MTIGRETRFEDTCEITGIKNDIAVVGEIMKFRENDIIIASIQRSAKVTLHWDARAELYIGSLGGVEFKSPGPKSTTVRTHR
jgi:thioredoxin reductase